MQVHLVNGHPDSFLFPLAAPRYARRELVHPDNELSTVPQLLGSTADILWGDNVGETTVAGAMGVSGVGGGSASYGMGHMGTVGHGAGVGQGLGQSSLLSVGNLAAVTQASGVEGGALFTYSLAEPLALPAHGSALLPFLQERIDVEAITWFESPGASARSAARVVNSTRQTLPQGPIAFYAGGGFAGESLLDRLKPGERRFVQYGDDLDVELGTLKTHVEDEPKRLEFADDTLTEHFLRKSELTYQIENKSGKERQVYLVLHLDRNATVQGADALDFDSVEAKAVAIFHLDPRKKAERLLHATEGLSRQTKLLALTSAQLATLAAADLPAQEKAAAAEATARQRELEATGRESGKVEVEIGKIEKDIARFRDHLKAQGGDKGQATGDSPFVRRILQEEDKLNGLRRQRESLQGEADRRRDLLQKALRPLHR